MAAPAQDPFELTAALSDLTQWLIRRGLDDTPVEEWLEEMCNRMLLAGIPIQRINITTRAHHPEIGTLAFRWHRDQENEVLEYARRNAASDEYLQSPLYYLISNNLKEIRHRLDVPDLEHDFPIYEELRARGSTEYFATKRYFLREDDASPVAPDSSEEGMIISVVTDQPGGFTEAQMDGIKSMLSPISLTLKCGANRKMAEDISAAYMGHDASRKVMSGAIQRGTCETLSAVIWYFDLQGFTKMTEELPGTAIISLLNDYFAEAVDVVEENGGNVLKFMGDGMLAVFDLDVLPDARRIAIEAAVELRDRIAAMNKERAAKRLPLTGFTLGLHAGNVLYGNIGGRTRLDFTVIGRAVNTTARILGMTGPVGQNIVISSAVAEPVKGIRPDLVSLGAYRLRGVTDRQELFTLD